MEKKNRDILDIIDEGIKEAYRIFDIRLPAKVF